jgi:hypothetical protein
MGLAFTSLTQEATMFSFQWYRVHAGTYSLLGMEDLVAPTREAAKRMAAATFDAEADLRGADRVTLHDNTTQEDFWEYGPT